MAARELKPIWNTSSFLVYAGGLTVLGGGLGALGYLSTQYPGHGQQTAWALLIYVVLFAIAYALRHADRPIAAGIFAFSSVQAWTALVVIAFTWWGWTNGADPFRHWSWSAIAAVLLILFAAADARRRFRFPFIRAISALYLFLLVNFVLPAGGNWTAVWALIVGLAYLVVGNVIDKPSAFWLHLVGGALIGGAIIYWCHTSTFDYAVVAFMSLVYVMWAYWTVRSSWAFWGTIGFFIVSVHFLVGSPSELAQGFVGSGSCRLGPQGGPPICTSTGPHISVWSFPLAFGLLGFWLVFLGMLGKRRRHAAIVIETPPPAPPAAPATE